jgi:DNA segregation ATPase FtsK/SpoIIIE, S-DNA-T family
MPEPRKIRNDIVAVGLLTLIVFLIAALGTYDPADPAFEASPLLTKIYQPDQLVYPCNARCTNACGRLGAWTADMLLHTLGIGAYYLVVGLMAMEIALFRRQGMVSPWFKTLGWAVSLIGLTSLSSLLLPATIVTPIVGPGGYLGLLTKSVMLLQIGKIGALILALSTFIVGMMMWTEYLVFKAGRVVFAPAFLALTVLLPFGLIHGFAQWFNKRRTRPKRRYTDLEENIALDKPRASDLSELKYRQDDEHESLIGPRTIKFRRRDLELDEEDGEETAAAGAASPKTGDAEGSLLEDVEAHNYETVEEIPVAFDIPESKIPDPAIVTEEAAAVAAPAVPIPKPHFKMRKSKNGALPSERDLVMDALNQADEHEAAANYELPNIEMLSYVESVPFEDQKRDAERNAIILEKTCKEFGYDVKVVEIEIGPVISQYEIELAPGLRLQKIVALADDLAIAMRVPSVRIVAPIPGKNSVGVEVPNKTRQFVTLRQLMDQSEKQIQKMKIPLFLGADAVGAPLVADLASLPHLLIAGRTGTGKSVCLNAIIASILMTRRPDEVRMLMIDPKMVELSGYARLPHLMHPVVTDMRKAEAILAWAVDKMEERYSLLARAGVRHVTSYNQLSPEEIFDRLDLQSEDERHTVPVNLPFIVIIADEMADLMMTAGKEVESHIIRLAQKSRAVGIHLILATQKPTVDVITGLIKSNLPARIAFQVASKVDSRVVLDEGGADKLLGMGDMLFLAPGTSTLLRGQGTYLSDKEIESITAAVSTGEQHFVHELINIKIKEAPDQEEDVPKKLENRDKLYEEAVTLVVREQRGSTSMLQQKMGIGYGRAARLIDFMAEDGYLGPYNGSKAREVLLTEAQWEAIRSGNYGDNSDREYAQPANSSSDHTASNKSLKRIDDAEPGQEHKPKSKSPRQPLKPLENITGLTSSLAAKSSILPPAQPKPKIARPAENDDDFDSDDVLDEDEELRDEYEEVIEENDFDDYQDDVEAAADDYEGGEESEEFDDEDYEYEPDDDYEDVE